MTIHEYLMQAVVDDGRRKVERDRLLLEARRARTGRRVAVETAGMSENAFTPPWAASPLPGSTIMWSR
jgi:hypothetical protein